MLLRVLENPADLIPRSSVDFMPWYSGKSEVYNYLVELNKTEKGKSYH